MNRRSGCLLALSLLVPALSLTSCMDRVQELYGEDEYLRGPLVDYYFTGRDDFESFLDEASLVGRGLCVVELAAQCYERYLRHFVVCFLYFRSFRSFALLRMTGRR